MTPQPVISSNLRQNVQLIIGSLQSQPNHLFLTKQVTSLMNELIENVQVAKRWKLADEYAPAIYQLRDHINWCINDMYLFTYSRRFTRKECSRCLELVRLTIVGLLPILKVYSPTKIKELINDYTCQVLNYITDAMMQVRDKKPKVKEKFANLLKEFIMIAFRYSEIHDNHLVHKV